MKSSHINKLNPFGFHEREVLIEDIIVNEKNPRVLSSFDRVQLSTSMEKFGLIDKPILNLLDDGKYRVIAGHQRLDILRVDKGIRKVTCMVPEIALTEKEEQELLVRHNKNTGDWDLSMLKEAFDKSALLNWGFKEVELGDEVAKTNTENLVVANDFEIEKMEAFLYEHHDYIIIKFNKFQDFLQAVNIFDLRKVDFSQTPKKKYIGIGRVMSSETFYEKLKDYVEKNNNQQG